MTMKRSFRHDPNLLRAKPTIHGRELPIREAADQRILHTFATWNRLGGSTPPVK